MASKPGAGKWKNFGSEGRSPRLHRLASASFLPLKKTSLHTQTNTSRHTYTVLIPKSTPKFLFRSHFHTLLAELRGGNFPEAKSSAVQFGVGSAEQTTLMTGV